MKNNLKLNAEYKSFNDFEAFVTTKYKMLSKKEKVQVYKRFERVLQQKVAQFNSLKETYLKEHEEVGKLLDLGHMVLEISK